MNDIIKRLKGENFQDYKYRLGENYKKYGLTWQQVCDLLNGESNLSFCESKWRKELQAVDKYKQYKDEVYNNKTRILTISDLHIPFHRDLNFLYDYKNKVDILIFNGDINDCQSVSKFMKKYREDFVDELILSRQIIMDIIDVIKPKKTIFNYGNHDNRVISYFSEKLHDDVLQLMPQTSLDFICEYGFYKHDYKNKSHTFYQPIKELYGEGEIEYTDNWFCKIGKTIFAHPKAYSQAILATADKAYLYFIKQGYTDIDSLVVAHTHKLGMYHDGSCWIVEQGSLCQPQEYAQSGSLTNPQTNGCAYIVQDEDGSFNFELSKLVWLKAGDNSGQ